MKPTTHLIIALQATVLMIIASLVAAQMGDDHQCVTPKAADANLFFATPTAADLGTHCSAYAAHSCCKPGYAHQVANDTDRIHAALVNGVLTNVNAQCEKLFDDLACLFCSPSSGTFIRPIGGPQGYEVMLCHSFCDKLYAACADALVVAEGSRKVSEVYPQGKDLCMSTPWYTPFFPEVMVDDPSCYDPEIRECTVNDYEGHYTECVNGRRDYMYNWKHNADGEPLCSGGVRLPPNKFQLRCDIACPAGQYLPGGSSTCAPCRPGTFSIGGGVRISEWNPANGWPTFDDGSISFSTYCQNRKTGAVSDCSGWSLHGQYITSGENKDQHDIESVLELDVVLVEPGNISFLVKVDSEVGFDGLRFEVSSTESHTINQRGEFKEYSFALAKGPHNLRWVYFKDFLFSAGEDRAYITWIEVDGTRYADDECSVCPAGTYNDEEGQRDCKQCGFNYIPSRNPPTTCVPCPADGYSIPGDASCHPRETCTREDYEEVFTDCRAPATPGGPGVRDKLYQWIQPQICIDSDHILPPNQVGIPCEPCKPGEYRAGNYKCRFCPEGRTSTGGDVSECTICQQNTAAIKAQIHNTFPGPWPPGWNTGCDACDTGGFRRHADHLDSGDGENLFFSWFSVNELFYVDGSFSFYATLECPAGDCSLAFWADDLLVGNWFSTPEGRAVNITQDVKAGNHTFYLDFARWIPIQTSHNHTNTRAIIHSIHLVGTQLGGAPTCVPCAEGSVSREGATMCTSCGLGSYPDPLVAGRCKPCPVDTIADRPGMAECLPCGPGTSTNGRQGQTECSNNDCIFSAALSSAWPVTFNFTALARFDSMWGPILDPIHGQSYWLNVCTRDHANSTCRNADGSIMETFACQITPQGASKDLGRLMSFTYKPPQSLDEEQVVLTYQYGTQCEQDTFVKQPTPLLPSGAGRETPEGIRELRNIYSTEGDRTTYVHQQIVPRERPMRSTNLTLVCDPTVGLGSPQAPLDGIEDQNELCRYDFVWYSLYACHICTKNDYDYRYTACENGLRMKTYYWKFSPRRCHGGDVQLPADVAEACTPSTTICADGEFVSPQYNNCTDCPPGNYSIGGGERTEWWSQNLRGFTVFCENDKGAVKPSCTGGWVPEGRTITAKGNIVDTTVLSAERNFVAEGSVSFDFSLFTENEEPFLFYMDDRLVASWNHTTVLGHTTYTHSGISKGTHVFKWKFSPFFSAEQPRIAMIWSITFRNTQYNEAFCNPCQGSMVQEDYGASSCHICPVNSVYHGPSACERCAENEFALPGDSICRPMEPCTADDYYEVYSPCNNGKRFTSWRPLQPKICYGDATPQSRFNLPCECPHGYYLQGDNCVTCAAGKHWDGTHCATAEAGTAVVKVREWLTIAQGAEVTLAPLTDKRQIDDHVWYTGCSGDCGNEGWRINGNKADSGAHYDAAVSWLAFYSTLEQDGEISFEIDISSHHQVGQEISLEFYINDTFLHIPRQPAPQTLTFPVSAGRHRFLWIHRQASQAVKGDQVSILSNVHVVGTTEGGMVKIVCPAGYSGRGNTAPCTPCPPGYYSSSSRQTTCQPCAHGYFSSSEGSSACLPCGLGTSPNKEEAATSCITSCKFETNATVDVDGVATPVTYHFDLTPMSKYGVLPAESTEKLGMKFTVQLCDKMTPLQPNNMCKQPTFVCEEELALHAYFTAGSLMAFQPNTGGEKPVHSGFSLEYSQGSSEECQGKNRKSIVHLQCRLGATPYTIFKLDYEHHEAEARACEFHFVLETEYACPFCTEADYRVINGECVEGTREIKYEANIPCLGLPTTKKESCSNIEVNEFAILVIAGAVVMMFVVLMAVAIFFWNKKRQMAQKYDLLVAETQAPLEMQPVGGSIDEEN